MAATEAYTSCASSMGHFHLFNCVHAEQIEFSKAIKSWSLSMTT